MASHVPPQKCWTCAKPMFASCMIDTRLECEECGFTSCGGCILNHRRKAHPSLHMAEDLPNLRQSRILAPDHERAKSTGPLAQVIRLNFERRSFG